MASDVQAKDSMALFETTASALNSAQAMLGPAG